MEDEALLWTAGGVPSGRSDLDNGTSFQMWELDFKSKKVCNLSRKISNLNLVCVVIKFVHLDNLSDNIEIGTSFATVFQRHGLGINLGADINSLETTVGPALEGGEN